MGSFPLLVARWFIIERIFCPGSMEHGGSLFLKSAQGGVERAVGLAKEVNRVNNAICKLHTPCTQECVSKSLAGTRTFRVARRTVSKTNL
jgi:hypothetical protein